MLSAPPREPANAERSQTCVQSLPQSKTTKFVTFDQHYSVLLCTPDPGNHHFTLHLQSFHFIRRGIHSANLAQDIVIIVNNIVLCILCTPVADSCQCMAKSIQYCKAK